MTAAPVDRAPGPSLIERASRWLEATLADGLLRAGWSRATDTCLVLGSAQRLDGPPAGHLPVVRRGTGGGAVVCDPSYLMLDVVLPAGDPRVTADLAESYRWLSDALLGALSSAGARGLRAVPPAEVRALPGAVRRAGRLACFAGMGPFEIVDARGRKLVGLAQRRRRGAALLQAAAYTDGTRESLADLLALEPAVRVELRRRLRGVATLDEVAPAFAAAPPAVWAEGTAR